MALKKIFLLRLILLTSILSQISCTVFSRESLAQRSPQTAQDQALPDFEWQDSEDASFAKKDLFREKAANELSIFWWNIDCFTQVTSIERSSTSDLEKNLNLLLEAKFKPDVLILGEYCPYYMPDHLEKKLKSAYKNYHHLERNIPFRRLSNGKVNERNGIIIYSDLDLNLEQQETLYAVGATEPDSPKNRVYLLFSVVKNNKKTYINPVHIYNPWTDLARQLSKPELWLEISGGKTNANAVQGRRLYELNTAYIPKDERFLSLGDFNSPKDFYFTDGYTYKIMSQSYESLIPESTSTFDNGDIKTSIDHAFGQNIDAVHAKVIPLAGASHKPIYLIIKN